MEREAARTGIIALWDPTEDPNQITEAWLWLTSFFLWGTYLERGEASVLINLPGHLHGRCGFFLRQVWVSELIGTWHQKGEQKKIERLLFGESGRGKRSFKTTVVNRWRNIEIYFRVERLRHQGVRCNEAIRQVREAFSRGQYGIREALSFDAVKKIYDRLRRPARD